MRRKKKATKKKTIGPMTAPLVLLTPEDAWRRRLVIAAHHRLGLSWTLAERLSTPRLLARVRADARASALMREMNAGSLELRSQ